MPEQPRPVLVVDLGAQYAQLIARRVREAHVYSEIVPHDLDAKGFAAKRPAGIILSGGPASVYEPGAPQLDPHIFDLGVPVLGLCYGHQLMARALGGEVAATGQREYGATVLHVSQPTLLLRDLPATDTVWMSHGDAVTRSPEGFRVTASTEQIAIAAMEDPDRALFAVQFHPEVSHTPNGQAVMKRFLVDGCGLLPDWTPTNIIDDAVERIRATVGDAKVYCALSGGVDSSVAALLVHRAVGDQLTCVFVDTGLLRAGEPEQVEETFARHLHVPFVHVKAGDDFFAGLAGVTDPESKRRIIGAGVGPRTSGERSARRGHRPRRDPSCRPGTRNRASVLRPPRGRPYRRGDGRWSDLPEPGRRSRRDVRGRDDRRLGAAAVRSAR